MDKLIFLSIYFFCLTDALQTRNYYLIIYCYNEFRLQQPTNAHAMKMSFMRQFTTVLTDVPGIHCPKVV